MDHPLPHALQDAEPGVAAPHAGGLGDQLALGTNQRHVCILGLAELHGGGEDGLGDAVSIGVGDLADDQADGASAGVMPTDLLMHTGKDNLGCEHHTLPRDQRHRFRLGGKRVREDLELEGFLGDLLHVDGPEAHCLADEAQQRGAVRGSHRDDCVAETAAGGSDLGPVGPVVPGVEVERAIHPRL
jgi:hypothetical protein